jgi:hypothetical protein
MQCADQSLVSLVEVRGLVYEASGFNQVTLMISALCCHLYLNIHQTNSELRLTAPSSLKTVRTPEYMSLAKRVSHMSSSIPPLIDDFSQSLKLKEYFSEQYRKLRTIVLA